MNGLQFAYQYAIGGAFFFLTFWGCTRRDDGLAVPPSDAWMRRVVLGGLGLCFGGHGLWILLA